MRFFFLILCLVLFCVCNAQKTYYFDATLGDDSRSSIQAQSQSTPWKTLPKLQSFWTSLNGGDFVALKSGETFYGNITCGKGGTLGNPITVTAYGSGARPIFTGLVSVTAWSNLGGNIWESTNAVSTLSTLNMVVINGVNTPMGRYPNSGYLTINSHTTSPLSVTSSALPTSPVYSTGECVIRKNHYVIDRCPITGMASHTVSYTEPPDPHSQGPYDAEDGYGFFIQNNASTLDQQNEWYYNPSTKKLRIYSTSSPTNVQISTIDKLIDITQQNYIAFDNIAFTGSNTQVCFIGSSLGIVFQNCNFDYNGVDVIDGDYNFGSSSSLTFQNNTVNHTNNNVITLADEFRSGYIGYNTITNTGAIQGMGGSFAPSYKVTHLETATNFTIEHNIVDSTGYIGLSFFNNSTVQYNFINNFCFVKDDGAGIYTYNSNNTTLSNMKVLHNIILNGIGAGAGTADNQNSANAIYLDDNSNHVEVAYNTGANCALTGLFLHNNSDLNVHDNLFYNNNTTVGTPLGGQTLINADGLGRPNSAITLNNNIFFSRTATQNAACMAIQGNTSGFSGWGTFTNNSYLRPIDDNLTFHIFSNSYSNEFYNTLAQWKVTSGLDGSSIKSPKTITTTNDLLFYYNETMSNKVISLPGTYIDAKSNTFVGSITLTPFTSAALIFFSGGGVTPLSVNASFTSISCNGNLSTITANASGGITPYTYQLDGGTPQVGATWTNQSAGTHTITVTDAVGTIASTTFTITQPSAITITESHTPITVNGNTSTITITAGGGTGTKQYKLGSGAYQSSNVFSGAIAGTYTVTVRDANNCTNTITFTITQPSVLVVSSSVLTAITCNGGNGVIRVIASGGTPPYTSTGDFTRAAGTWSFTVTDAGGASQTTTTTITQPTAITITESHTTIAINGGTSTVTITASGGTGALNYRIGSGSYQASNVFSGVVAGTYTVTVRDANLCTNTITFTITQPTALVVSAAVTVPIPCNNFTGTAHVTASGGTSPYQYKVGSGSYQASADFSGLAAGTYVFTVLDAGGAVVSSSPLTISQPTAITINLAYGTAPATVVVTASGGAGSPYTYSIGGITYQASNTFNGVAAGNYTMFVKDANGCANTKTFTVIAAGTPLSLSLSGGTITCNGGVASATLTPAGGTAPYTYSWSNGQTTQTATNLTFGTYTGSVFDNVGARHDTTFNVTQPLPITVSVSYPPIAANGGTTTITASGTNGVGTLQYSIDGGSYQLSNSFAGVFAGNHYVDIKDANNCTSRYSFTVTQPGQLYIAVSPTTISCYNGTSTVTITGNGGTGTITVTGGSPQVKSAGTYTFTVTDGLGAVHDTIVTISQPTQISISVTTGTIITNGGTTTVTATASGGTGSLQYKIDAGSYQGTGSFSGITAGTHTVTVKDANNCTNTNTFSISQPGQLYVTATPTLGSLNCYNDVTTVTVVGTGGTTPLTYGKNGTFQGSGTFSNIAAGTYTFSVKDAFNAQHDTLLTITQPTQVQVVQVRPLTISTYGGTTSIIITATGGTGTLNYKLDLSAYQSDTVFTNVSAGVHTVYVRDANLCVNSFTFTITQPPPSPTSYILRKRKVRHRWIQE